MSTSQPADGNIFKFVPFSSFVQASFWHKLTELKLDVDRLSETRRTIRGFYSNANNPGQLKSVHEVDCTGFNSLAESTKPGIHNSFGVLHNKNTIESFKAVDKVALLNEECTQLWQRILRGDALTDPTLLAPFLLLSFADLKKHHFYYWFAFPTVARQVATIDNIRAASEHFTPAELTQIGRAYFAESTAQHRSFFMLQTSQGGGFVHRRLDTLIDAQNMDENFAAAGSTDSVYFCFSDPSVVAENAGWPARLFVAMLLALCPRLRGQLIRLLAVRCDNAFSVQPSVVFEIRLTNESLQGTDGSMQFIGWERNEQAKMLPRMANMAASMDPERLAKTSVSLNLKLMKWRLMPTLDLDRIADTKCLLMGAGTLGCAVARNLIAWGVKHITFVDNGKVSHSNPVRQSLFVFEDAHRGRDKAPTAAKRLAEICPGLQTAGHSMHIPMPGHPVGVSSTAQQKTHADIVQLEQLVRQHDVVFLLTDSRESRWLPTMLGAAHDKIVMNAALGFDSYLVMRHGSRKSSAGVDAETATTELAGLKCIDGSKLGCYFCNDITAPGNSLKDRTLDHQCTVTRPGVSNIAGALAVELLVSLLQHERAELAPAYISCRQDATSTATMAAAVPEGLLGIIPHSLRGQLHNFEQILPATERYRECIACSEKVLHEYRTNGNAFLFEVFNSAKYLEDLTGINEAFHCRDDDELLELLSDSDDFE